MIRRDEFDLIPLSAVIEDYFERLEAFHKNGGPRPLRETESPIEEGIDRVIRRELEFDRGHLARQVDAATPHGRFRFDLVLETVEGPKVAIEADGREFHDPRRDEWRDAITLGVGAVDEVWRFPGSAIHNVPRACVYLLAKHFPRTLSARPVRHHAYVGTMDGEVVELDPAGFVITTHLRRRLTISRRTRDLRAGPQRWCRLWKFARLAGAMPLDALIELYGSPASAPLHARLDAWWEPRARACFEAERKRTGILAAEAFDFDLRRQQKGPDWSLEWERERDEYDDAAE